ncbi:MAG: glutamate synthase [Deltaproteobacteria bacterium RIFCSPLOWO2_12_FULL_43_16]|nr:MAG: glutamate synthase [Deltaproteobacteria bacterium GWA2_43_19]OGQ09323.1 MAG: glutamate synthase [Deltaproteobacteria bacterium RIFCSPHIGHO2_02_FULL_43_33]OGQ38684.1 MAG: glutamate synthase [Deltaproteobacteria bacterium RIFCSPLOWO2_01_FULL_42_9]OGQ57973.1 MAG: glutamate synthase [Deltaproteobacteria bacterium RIFCSPLOWO2_12_FULL_43_16]HBR17019.1 FMN-binding glutamate synthase family protein [Deltaproteobacteria bacterium]
MFRSLAVPEFLAKIDQVKCIRCKRCIQNCGWSVYSWGGDKVLIDTFKCVKCLRCYHYCPEEAITIEDNPVKYRSNANWGFYQIRNIKKQAETGGIPLTGMGSDMPYPVLFDNLLIDACQVTNPSIDPLREPMELRTYLGKKPAKLEFEKVAGGKPKLKTKMPPQIKLEMPFIFAPMSYGSISLNAQKTLAIAAKELGIVMNTGEGGLHEDIYPYRSNIIVQVASGRFGVNPDYLNAGVAVEIKIGQGAKPGIGGHLPGEKIPLDIAKTRMIPVGTDAISPAPQHDIYSIEDLRQLIFAIKEATNYTKPVSVKIAAVHNVAAIASGIVRAGADIVYIDGFRGGTGAAPVIIRDHLGIPIEYALAAVDERLRQEGIRNEASIIAAGGIRSCADAAKAIALGADAVALGTSALITMGCTVCGKCYTGNCSWGITTQRPELTVRLDPEVYAERLINLIHAWSHELKEILGALGVNAIESLRGSRERLRGVGLDGQTLDLLGVKPAGR